MYIFKVHFTSTSSIAPKVNIKCISLGQLGKGEHKKGVTDPSIFIYRRIPEFEQQRANKATGMLN